MKLSVTKPSASPCDSCTLADGPGVASSDLLVCQCFSVHESTVRHVVEQGGAESVTAVTRQCGAGGGCGACHVRIERVLRGMPAKCGSGRFDLCGGCGSIGALCGCSVTEEQEAVA